MCIGNRATHSAFYINKQLEGLWEISTECVKKHGYGIKASRVEVEYGSSLAQFCVGKNKTIKPSAQDLTFFASFSSPPQIKFICNHEVVLFIHIKEGHYKLEGKNTLNRYESYTCAFRVPFTEHVVSDINFTHFGLSASCKTKFLILDLNSALFIRDLSYFAGGQKLTPEIVDLHHRNVDKVLTTQYLTLLRKAGHHCLYSLPDFDNLSRTHLIDYSSASEIDVETSEIFGINVEIINTFITGRWLEAAACIDNLDEDHDGSLSGKYALAEHRALHEEVHFHAFFGPPQIRVRCSKEVIFFIDVQELSFYMEGGFESQTVHKVNNWKLAFIIDASLIEEEGGSVKRIRLDFSRARFSESHSICISEHIEETILVHLRQIFIHYISERYLTILEEQEHHHVYHVDKRVVEPEVGEEDDSLFEDDLRGTIVSREFKEHLTITSTFNFDIITTVAQGSINDHFRFLWKASQAAHGILSCWAHGDYFDAAFGPLQIQFPSGPRSHSVIVHVSLLEGFLTSLGHDKKYVGGEKHEFSGWRIAFEVDLKLRNYTKHHDISDTRLKQAGGEVGAYVLKQLLLDFKTARVRYGLSKLPGLFEGSKSYFTRSMCGALLHYITELYFGQLQSEGYHILYSIPTWKEGSSGGIIKYAPSTFDFQFLSAPEEGTGYVSAIFGRQRSLGERNMLVICGMLDAKAKRPTLPLPDCSWRWTSSEQRFSGITAISRSAFLDGWLLKELTRLNARTTLVPVFHGIGDAGQWDIELVKWSEHPIAKGKSCNWKELGKSKEGLEFQWMYKDDWTYTHEGDASHIYNGGYTVSCKTTNNLYLPTTTRQGVCEIKVKGQVDLKLAFRGAEKHWSTSACVHWGASILISSDVHGSGLKIDHIHTADIPKDPNFAGDREMVHLKFRDAATLLQQKFQGLEFIEQDTVKGLESSFSGIWPLFYSGSYGYKVANPVFNLHGDLLLELVSPLERDGCIAVSERNRKDIHMPQKSQNNSRYIKEESAQTGSGYSFFTTIKNTLQGTVLTPPVDHVSHHSSINGTEITWGEKDPSIMSSDKGTVVTHQNGSVHTKVTKVTTSTASLVSGVEVD